MAWFIECPFCHKSVFRWFYSWHESKHTARRADGQMHEHVTLAPDKRFEGSLTGVPRAYHHAKCGVTTGMPEEIIRTYLVNPLTYGDSSFCCGCGDYIVSSELTWTETGESVMGYMGRLRTDHLRAIGADPLAAEIFLTPGTAGWIRRIAEETGDGKSCYLAISLIQNPTNGNYNVSLAPTWDPQTEDLIKANGIDVVVPKNQRKLLKGTMIHFQDAPVQGFVVARLYPWK